MRLNANQVSALASTLNEYDLFHVDAESDPLDYRVAEFKLWDFYHESLLHININENGTVFVLNKVGV